MAAQPPCRSGFCKCLCQVKDLPRDSCPAGGGLPSRLLTELTEEPHHLPRDQYITSSRTIGIYKPDLIANLSLQMKTWFRLAVVMSPELGGMRMLPCSPRPQRGASCPRGQGRTKGLAAVKGIEAFCHKCFNGSFVSLAWHGEWLHHLELQTLECASF